MGMFHRSATTKSSLLCQHKKNMITYLLHESLELHQINNIQNLINITIYTILLITLRYSLLYRPLNHDNSQINV